MLFLYYVEQIISAIVALKLIWISLNFFISKKICHWDAENKLCLTLIYLLVPEKSMEMQIAS